MNRERLTRYLDYYVENEEAIHEQGYEGYKWEILRKIQCVYIPYKKAHIRNGIWDDDLEAFQSLVQTIYSHSGNLVYSSANSVLGRLLKYKPAELKALFQQLTGEGDRKDRMLHFVQGMEQLAQDDRISKSHKSFHSDFRSASFYLSFDNDNGAMLPIMKSDITLSCGNKVLIIDAKYYSHTTQARFEKNTIHSSNLYQIFTYVKNKEAGFQDSSHEVSGMLLYAKTDDAIQPENTYQMSGNRISVKTLDLAGSFDEIEYQLYRIAKEHFGDKAGVPVSSRNKAIEVGNHS